MDDDVIMDVIVQQCCATMYTTVTLLLCYPAMGSQFFQHAVYRQSFSKHVVVCFITSFSSPSSMVMVVHDTIAFYLYYS